MGHLDGHRLAAAMSAFRGVVWQALEVGLSAFGKPRPEPRTPQVARGWLGVGFLRNAYLLADGQ